MPRGAYPADMDEPPSYGHGHRPLSFSDPVVQPATLRAAGRFVYSDNPRAPPLYELSHAVGFLSNTDRVVRVERLDHALKQHGAGGAPRVSTRSKHMYDLKRPPPITSPAFPFHAEPASRQSLGSLGVTSLRPWRLSSARGYRVHRAARGPDHRLVSQDVLFTAMPAKDKAVTFEWFDAQNRLLARELEERGGLLSLLVSAEMSLRTRDALVAAWMLKVWWEMAKDNGRWKPLMT